MPGAIAEAILRCAPEGLFYETVPRRISGVPRGERT